MPRIRTIKPEFTQHEDLSKLPAETHLFAAGLLCYADDEGYFKANPDLVESAIFPIRKLSQTIQGMFSDLSRIGYVRLGETPDGKRYGHIINFLEHQVVNRGKKSKIKDLPIKWDESHTHPLYSSEESLINHGNITDESSGKGKERKGKESPSPPSTQEVQQPDPNTGDLEPEPQKPKTSSLTTEQELKGDASEAVRLLAELRRGSFGLDTQAVMRDAALSELKTGKSPPEVAKLFHRAINAYNQAVESPFRKPLKDFFSGSGLWREYAEGKAGKPRELTGEELRRSQEQTDAKRDQILAASIEASQRKRAQKEQEQMLTAKPKGGVM